MSFPVEPRPDEIDHRGLFLVQDPEVRSRVLPLFRFDPNDPEKRPEGHGTTFRIDMWSRCVTAFHVVEDLLEVNATGTASALRSDCRLLALEVNGLVYGKFPLPPDAWRPVAELYTFHGCETPPFQPARLRNVLELAGLRITQSTGSDQGTPYFPIDLRRWHPQVDERVLALGYADLDKSSEDESWPISQYLYGSFGKIIDVISADGSCGRPWPAIRVKAEWPGGMSGGPVFNETGHVIGVVSSGINGSDVSSATFFSGWSMPERIFGTIDPDNPGWFFCHGVFDNAEQLVFATQDEVKARRFAEERGVADKGIISIKPQSGDYVRC